MTSLDDSQIREQISALEARLEEARTEREAAARREAMLNAEIEAFRSVLRARDAGGGVVAADVSAEPTSDPVSQIGPAPGTRIGHDVVIDAAVRELQRAAGPLEVKELLQRLISGGVVPSGWVTSNLSAHLIRAEDRVRSVKRGLYELADPATSEEEEMNGAD